MAWGDYDNDGDLDLALSGSTANSDASGATTRIYKNTSGSFSNSGTVMTGVWYGSLAWSDYDQDGRLDLASTGQTSVSSINSTKLYHNTAGGFIDSGIVLPAVYGTVAWGDYNNDGKPDLLVTGDNTNTALTVLYRNTGSSLTSSGLSLPAFKNGGAAWGDYNNDGALDLIQIGYNSSFAPSTSIYRNETCAAELSITKTTSQSVAGHGQTVQYLLNYGNSGTLAASSVVITDTVPAQLTGVSFQSSRTITPTGTYVWQVGTLAIGASGTITVTGQVDAGVTARTIFTNTVSISIAPGEVTTSNNSSSAATRVSFTVSSTSPQANAFPVALNAPVTLTFSDDANTSTISSTSVILYGSMSGVISTTMSYNSGSHVLTLTPLAVFKQGEIIRVRATSTVMSSAGVALQPYQWEFTAGATGNSCIDSISPISTGLPNKADDDVAWGDYDKDGDLDLLMIGDSTGKIYRNNGNGTFTDIGAGLPNTTSASAAWGDYDNDGYLDFVISGNASAAFTRLYHNNRNGSFTNMGNSGMSSFYISTLAWGDYDNDGYLDLAFTGANINTGTKFTKLYHNNRNSTFGDSGISLTNVAGGSLNWGDYDKDGNLDLLLIGQDNSSASITKLYHNNGNSTFSEVTGTGLPIVISGAAAWGDYNGDSNLDVLMSGYMGSSPSSRIYRNNGNGTFSDINAGLPGLQSSAVAWGDYNNDGKLDFVLSGETSLSTPPYAPITKIYENHGSGSFSDSGFTFTGLFYTALAWGDENGDGFLDLLTTGYYDGTYTPLTKLYHNSPCQPDLGITKSATPSQATPGQPIVYTLTYSNAGTLPASTVVITDIVPTEVMSPTFQSSPAVTTIGGNTYVWQVGTLAPGAGGVITVTGQVSSSLTFSSIFTNTATIHTSSFEVKQANNSSTVVSRVTFHIISTSPGTNAQSVSLTAPISAVFNADLNASTITSSTFTLRGSMSGVITGTLSYNAGTRTLLLTPSRPFKASEVLRVSATSGIQSTLGTSLESYQWEFTAGTIENRCFGGLSDTGIVMPRIAFGTAAWGDYDNDGLPDLLLAGTLQSGTIATRIYHNNGDGSFSTVSAGLPGVTGGAAAWGDYDNDGKLDLVLIGSSSSGSIAKIYHNTGSGFADSGISLQGLASGAAAWGDYDNDGNLDLVLSGQDSSNSTVFTKLYHNNGNGSFSTVSAGFANVYSAALAWGDYNNDGSLDLLVAGNTVSSGSTGITKIYKNNGNSTFSDSGISLQGLYSGAAAWGDYDGDGNLDLVLSGSNSAYAPVTKLYHNNGAGTLSDSGVALANLSGSAAAWGDYDNDGKLDLVLSGSNSVPITKLYHNNGSGSFSGSSSGLPQASYGALAWGDYNGDNRLELAIFGYKNNAEYVGSLYRTNDCADLGIKKSVTPVLLMPGQPIAYTLVYSNTGAGIATAVLITDTLPAQLTSLNYTSSGPALTTIGSTPYVWSAGNLAPGASGVITVTGIVSPNLSADQSIPNTASISNSSIETSYANNSSGATVGVVVPRARFSGTSYQVGEGGGSATITVTLDVANPNAAVTVDYATANGTALDGSDYTAEHATLTIPAGQTSATFTIPIIDDALNEPTETILLSLSGPGGAALGSPATATLSIIDDDPSVVVPHVNFSGTSYQVGEGGGSATITVTLDVANPNAAVTVDYATANGTALDGSDYTGTLATLTIPAGQTSATFTIPIIDDALSEPTETILLSLSGPGGAALGSQASATLSIIDDELSTTYLIYLPIVSRS